MIPKLDISMPDLLYRLFYYPKIYGPEEKLQADIKEFKDFFEKNGETILSLIHKFSGFDWKGEKIPVYLVPESPFGPPYSFTSRKMEGEMTGVLQKIGYKTPERIVHIHIHELAHVNQHRSDYYPLYGWNKEKNERKVDSAELAADIVTLYVLRELFGLNSSYETDMWDFLSGSQKNIRKGEILRKYMDIWDLNKNPLRYYLEENKDKLENLL